MLLEIATGTCTRMKVAVLLLASAYYSDARIATSGHGIDRSVLRFRGGTDQQKLVRASMDYADVKWRREGVLSSMQSSARRVSDFLLSLDAEPGEKASPPPPFSLEVAPILRWLPKTKAADAIGDIIACLTVTTMLIPQGMAYSTLAGLSPIVGLYCYVPLLVYAILGTSSFLVVGPVALVSTTVFSMVATLEGPARAAMASALMFACGVLSTVLGVLGLARIVDYVPKDVLSAFTTGAAFNLMFTQLGPIFGIKVATSHMPIVMLKNALVALPTLHMYTTGLSAAAIAALLALKKLPLHAWLKLSESVPKSIFGTLGPFTVMVLSTLLNSVYGLSQKRGLAEVGVVPSGLPSLSSPLGVSLAGRSKDIAVLTFVVLLESLAIGKSLAAKAGQSINSAQEFVAIGLANVAGSFFQGYSIAASFSRSAIFVSTGGKSQLGGIGSAISLMLILTFFTPLFTHVPKAALAAVLMVATSNLIDTQRIAELWTQSKGKFALYAVYVGLMLVFGAGEGLLASIALFYAVNVLKRVGLPLPF